MTKKLRGGLITFEKWGNRTPNSVGSSRIRGDWLAKYWDELEEWKVGQKYDFIIFQKAFFDQMLDNYDGIKIFDTCDPDWLERDDAFKWYDKCDAITCSTEALRDYIQLLLPEKVVEYIPDRIDFEVHTPIKKEHNDKLKALVWFGYSHNVHFLSKTFKTLLKNNLRLTVYSESRIEQPKEYKDLVLKWLKYDYTSLHKHLIKYDAALMPTGRELVDIRGKYKSDNKTKTCMALGLPVISTPEDIERLESKKAREDEANKNLKVARKDYDVKSSIKEYKELINKIIRRKQIL